MKTKLILFVAVLIAALFGGGCASVETGGDPLKKGLVAYLPFNGNSIDASGNGNHGGVNGAGLTNDRHGNENSAYSFDGKDDFIDLGNQPEFNFGKGDFSLSCWVQHAEGLNRGFISKRSPRYQPPGYALGEHQNYALASIWDPGEDRPVETEGGKSLADGGWHQVSAIFDRDANLVIYVDGVPVATRDISGESGSIDNDESLKISSRFHGSIDEVRIYNRALSAGEVKALYILEHFPKPKSK